MWIHLDPHDALMPWKSGAMVGSVGGLEAGYLSVGSVAYVQGRAELP